MLEDFFEEIVKIDVTSESDGMGGFEVGYKEGAKFLGAVTLVNTTEVRIADKTEANSIYNIIVKDNVPLQHNDIVKRTSDGRVFRISSLLEDARVPKSSSLKVLKYNAVLHTLD